MLILPWLIARQRGNENANARQEVCHYKRVEKAELMTE